MTPCADRLGWTTGIYGANDWIVLLQHQNPTPNLIKEGDYFIERLHLFIYFWPGSGQQSSL